MSNDFRLVPLTEADCLTVLPMIRAFCIEDGVAFEERIPALLLELLANPHLGRLFLLKNARLTLGYAVLSWRFCLEYGGKIAHLDEFYLTPPARGQGVGTAFIDALAAECVQLGVRKIFLETVVVNSGAREFYRKVQFQLSGRISQYLDLTAR